MANDEAEEGQRWAKGLVERVGASIKAGRKGKSAAWLSDRTAELGYRVSPTVIAKLDSGHRGAVLSVAELLVLAAALNTSPVNLLFPGPYDAEVEFLPGRYETEHAAAEWFSGLQAATSLVGPYVEGWSKFRGDWNEWDANTSVLEKWRELHAHESARIELSEDEQLLNQLSSIQEQIEQARKQLSERSRDA